MTNAKLLTYFYKRQMVSSKLGKTIVTWSLLPFAVLSFVVHVVLNLSVAERKAGKPRKILFREFSPNREPLRFALVPVPCDTAGSVR